MHNDLEANLKVGLSIYDGLECNFHASTSIRSGPISFGDDQ